MTAPAIDDDTYIGTAPCGCVRAAIVIRPHRVQETAAFVKGMIHDGLKVQSTTAEAARALKWGCERCDPKGHAKQGELPL